MNQSNEIILSNGHTIIVDSDYFPLLSRFTWAINKNNDITKTTKVYAQTYIQGELILLHRFLLNPPKWLLVDHINGNGLDNRVSNLRLTDKQGNAANRPKDRLKNPSSKYKGVSFCKGNKKWKGQISVKGKTIYLGYFLNEIQAAEAYNIAAKKYFGEFSCPNQFV